MKVGLKFVQSGIASSALELTVKLELTMPKAFVLLPSRLQASALLLSLLLVALAAWKIAKKLNLIKKQFL